MQTSVLDEYISQYFSTDAIWEFKVVCCRKIASFLSAPQIFKPLTPLLETHLFAIVNLHSHCNVAIGSVS